MAEHMCQLILALLTPFCLLTNKMTFTSDSLSCQRSHVLQNFLYQCFPTIICVSVLSVNSTSCASSPFQQSAIKLKPSVSAGIYLLNMLFYQDLLSFIDNQPCKTGIKNKEDGDNMGTLI